MKRLTAMFLCLFMVFSLCACRANTDINSESQNSTEPTEATAPDGRPVYSDLPMIEYPQTGEYKETALLTNVPGQGVPLLLDMRDDGTVDYIFASTEGYRLDNNRQQLSFQENGVKYYSIAPDGTATLHNEKWINEIDSYVEMTNAAANIENGRWIFTFAAEEGTILILGQFGPNLHAVEKILVTVLFKIQNDQVTIIPIDYHVDYNGEPANWSAASIADLRLENGYVFFESRNHDTPVYISEDYPCVYATYHLNGTLSDMVSHDNIGKLGVWAGSGATSTVISVNSDGKICMDEVYWPAPFQYTEDETLYYLGKYDNGLLHRSNISMTTFENPGEDFCCWFDEAGQGVLMRYTYAPEGKIEPEIVTVWSLEPIDLIKTAVAQWNHTHASPIFRYETAADEMNNTNLTEEDILTRLNLELLNNRGPDVLILDGLDVDKYLDFTVPLDQVDTAGVYSSLLDRFTVDGELLALPIRTVPYLLGRVTEDTQKIGSLEQFADLITASSGVLNVRDAVDGMPHPKALFYIRNYDQLFRLWYPAWADTIWEGGKLNRAAFTEFLTQTTRVVDHYTLTEPQENWGIVKPTGSETLDTAFDPVFTETDIFYSYYMQPPYTLAAPNYVGLDAYWYFDTSSNNTGKAIPHYIESIPGPDGSGIMIPRLIAGVRAGGNEAAGQEFVQLLLSREMQLGWAYHYDDDATTGYPVIWEHTETVIHRHEERKRLECAVQNSFEDTVANLRTVVIDEYLFEAALTAAQCCYRTENRLTPEEAAAILEEATRIYLAEKR